MRVITGGQIGVDLGAWRAARNHGLPTGGWMPCGYQTEVVAYPEFAGRFGATALPEEWEDRPLADQYHERTRRNVVEATHVLLLTTDAESPGSNLAWRLAIEHQRDRFGVPWAPGIVDPVADDIFLRIAREFARNCWAAEGTLLVAGTRESKAPGISEYAHRFMSMVFEAIPMEDNP